MEKVIANAKKLSAASGRVPIVYAGRSEPNHWETNHPWLVHWGGFLVAATVCAAILGLLQLLVRIGA